MGLTNPFRRNDLAEYPSVLVPLHEAQRHPSVVQKAEEKKLSKHDSDIETSPQYSSYTIEGLRSEIDTDLVASGVNTAYDKKSKVINKAIQDIGMGRYQWELFVLCGFGWMADNLWLQGIALTLPQISKTFPEEFEGFPNRIRYTTCAAFVGLCCGATLWGTASDVIGRRLAFNCTLLIAGVFGIAAGAAPSWIGVCGLYAVLGFGVGGNLPVDGALFLEFLPFASGALLTMLSAWWPIGTLVSSMIAWGFIPNYPDDKGWRYLIYTLGALTFAMFCCRFFLFHLFESPKFLLARGRQREAVAVVHGIAYKNKRKTWLTEEILNEIGGDPAIVGETKLTTAEILKREMGKFSTERIGPLFRTRKLAISTCLIWFLWTTIGMGYPLFNAFLPQYFSEGNASTYIVYRNYAITAVVGVPGSILAWWTVDIKYIGRKGTMGISTLFTGVFLFLFTISKDSNYQLAMSCVVSFFQNIMYGVLYAYTPEVFPAPNRGTGTGISSLLNRLAGLCAPIIAANASTNPLTPLYVSGALFLAAFIAMICLPIETRGKQSL